ncbi:hypothetical protein RHVP.66 [Cricetid gammaherpesvirus 2]|uniref:Protein UL49 n=1 Tax=Cricetid gammaherpesvirus 2 TaxID=1605972 RepID=E9M5P9_9GAMA|nr:hypothetical protein RHVP.66 [Cricetid gammaherpesvirus 2]ADW24407.1 hypothetical protein RHVP.66 [Cricetid gammaherpesvirus 2]ADW24489.1 hypothetical protein RHVP-L.66 [Cricetid gammaherpesvirus 2]
METPMEPLCRLKIGAQDYTQFCLYGAQLCYQHGWQKLLLSSLPLKKAVTFLLDINGDIKKKWACKQITFECAKALLLRFAMVLYSEVLEADPCELPTLAQTVYYKLVGMSYIKAVELYANMLFVGIKFPLIRVYEEHPLSMPFTKKRYSVGLLSDSHMSVIPSVKRGMEKFTVSQTPEDPEEIAFVSALKDSCKEQPCGNVFYYMMCKLCSEMLVQKRCGIIPLQFIGKRSVYDIALKVTCINLLSSVIRLKIISPRLKQMAAAGHKYKIVLCMECGHCLNIGRGKFLAPSFSPTSVFYCRDQKEKQFTICATTGRIYCAYCGSSDISLCDMIGMAHGTEPFIRVVCASNAVAMLKDTSQKLDVVMPCLGETRSCTIKRRVTVAELLYLTATPERFVCGRCSTPQQ